jgi:hypothetical protein
MMYAAMNRFRHICVTGLLLELAAAAAFSAAPARARRIAVSEYRERVYASWLGQCVGNIYGLPHENKYIAEPGPETWPYGYSGNLDRLRKTNGVFSDDDTDFEYLYLMAMESFGTEPSGEQLAELWKRHIRDLVWLANRAALASMHHGWTPPVTGQREYNPHWFQIDPQLVNEIWGVTAPGMPRYAAAKSGFTARLTSDSWGIEPTMHYGAMFAAAFFEHDVNKLIDIGTANLPPGSRFAQTVEDMKALYRLYPHDWKKARAAMAEKYYENEPALTKTIWNSNLNGAAGILALLYGQGDFQRTLDLACAIGFDADNQAATMSGLVALVNGVDGIPRELLYPFPEAAWKQPFNDLYKNVTRYDVPDASLRDMTLRMALQGEKIILAHGGRKVTENGVDYYEINSDAEYVAPLELAAGPLPDFESGVEGEYQFVVSGGSGELSVRAAGGRLPAGLRLDPATGRLHGVARTPGHYPVTLEAARGGKTARRVYSILVHGPNLAPGSADVLASVHEADAEFRNTLWLVVGKPMYADHVDVIRDGKRRGEGQTFYSLRRDRHETTDYYGYRWDQPQRLGLINFCTGVMEESSGWFTALAVEYQDESQVWKPVTGLAIEPQLPSDNGPFNKPTFGQYWLRFNPVVTKAVRIIGPLGGIKHWKDGELHFSSIAELEVYGPIVWR